MKKLFLIFNICFLATLNFNLNVYAEELNIENVEPILEEVVPAELVSDEEIQVQLVIDEEIQVQLVSDEEIQVQHDAVSIKKIDEKGELLAGSKLQVLDLEGNVLYEWISDGTVHVVTLTAGKYVLHEVEAPEGYVISEDQEFEVVIDEEIQVQHTTVSIKKTNEKGELLVGSKLQVLDLEGNVLYEWISDGTVHVVTLTAGKYVLHEVEAPEGYTISEDQEFEVEVVIDEEIIGDANMSDIPCNHGDDNKSPMYYIEINGISYEVYCINQGLNTPDGINYNGQILTPEDIRKFTLQETDIDGEGFTISGNRINVNTETVLDYDVSDQTLTDQELYDKVLDIIYHRYLAEQDERFKDLSTEEIRYITEIALKNYLNARITTYETVRTLKGTTVSHTSYNINGEVWQDGDGAKYIKLYNKYYNREYLYDSNSPTGYVINSGNGDSLGNFAKHWYHYHNKTKLSETYADLFYFLIGNEFSHPESMQIFMYSPTAVSSESPYQNLLGITGYIEGASTEERVVEMVDKYSDEKRDITVVKIWEEDVHDSEYRPLYIEVNLFGDGELIESVELSEENNWSYTFTELDMYKEGKSIVYTISEVEVSGYKTVINGNMEDGFTIINIPYGMGSVIPPNSDDYSDIVVNPETGDNIHNSIFMVIISLIGLVGSTLYIRADHKFN